MPLSIRAQWRDLVQDEDIRYLWDVQSVRSSHIHRYVWMLVNLSQASKTTNGQDYLSVLTRYRLHCRNDTFVKLSESFYQKLEAKGLEVMQAEFRESQMADKAIRPGTPLALLKKEICTASQNRSSE